MNRLLGLLAVLGLLIAALAAFKPSIGWNAHAIAYLSLGIAVFVNWRGGRGPQ